MTAMPFSGHDTKNLRSGDPSAFDRLYASFAPRVLAYLLRLTGGSRADAEDLTQETFLAAYSTRSEISGGDALAWLFGVARRRQRDNFRARSARPETSAAESGEIADVAPPIPEATARKVVLQEALNQLSLPEREAILLVVVQGLTYAEAATVMEEPAGTVKWRVHSGTRRLRRLLSGTFAEEAPARTSRKETVSHGETEQTKTVAV
jgi:RNA polymerase sigma-70 factor (ECF subfamily)